MLLTITEYGDLPSENVIMPAAVTCFWNDLNSVARLDGMHPLTKRLVPLFKVPFDLALPGFTNCMRIVQQLPAWKTLAS